MVCFGGERWGAFESDKKKEDRRRRRRRVEANQENNGANVWK